MQKRAFYTRQARTPDKRNRRFPANKHRLRRGVPQQALAVFRQGQQIRVESPEKVCFAGFFEVSCQNRKISHNFYKKVLTFA